jgi:Flp pilus assembly protein TadG
MQRNRQRGATLVLVIIALAALIGAAGLALDTAHVVLNKSRLQSSLDSAALAAAKVLDQSASTAQATAAANSVFALNLAQYPELQAAVGSGLTMTTQYSATLIPFAVGTLPARFVRTSVVGFTTQMSLVSVLGIGSINVTGSAVAGPSPSLIQACNIVPIMMCGNAGAGAPLFGYNVGQVVGLNRVPSSNPTAGELGPGNYNLLSVGGTGAAVLRTNFAGDFSACATIGNNVTTEPGVAAGPVTQGLNTRFNEYGAGLNAADYPPDVINSAAHQTSLTLDNAGNVQQGQITNPTAAQLTFNWGNYNALQPSGPYDTQPMPNGTGAFRRREVAAPIGDCSSAINGRGDINVLGFACLYLLQKVDNGGKHVLFAEVLQTCDAGGRPGAGSGTIGPHVIQLYKSAASPDS